MENEKRFYYTGAATNSPEAATTEALVIEAPVKEINNIPDPVVIASDPVPAIEAPVITPEVTINEYKVYFSAPVKDIKNMFTVFKPVVTEIKLIFRKNEIFISHVDPAHVCMASLKIPDRSLLEYKAILNDLNEIELSIDLDRFLNMFKGSDKNDIITFSYNSNNDKIVNIGIGSFKYELNLIDGSCMPPSPKIPSLSLPASFEIDIKTFNNFLNQASSISDFIDIKTTNNDLTLNAVNDINKVNLVLTRDQLSFLNSNSSHNSKFSLDYLLNIFKGLKNLYQKVNIEIGDDHPLRITGSGASEITVLLAPRIEES